MSLEIEKKYRIDAAQTERVCADLFELKAEFVGEDFEENTLFGGAILGDQNAILRVRKTKEKAIVTFKRRVQSDFDVKQSVEYETEVANAEAFENILTSLGFQRTLVYEKRRRTWKFRDVEVVLDELPFGLFMEIEGEVMAIRETEMYLGAEEFEVVHETYPNLTLKYGQLNGNLVEARFPEG
jgi:adenylate cyclase, class 2